MQRHLPTTLRTRMRLAPGGAWLILFLTCLPSGPVAAQLLDTEENVSPRGSALSRADDARQVVEYTADFFSRYHPNAALDMVNQLPGFQLDDGSEELRGYSSTTGNLLINDRRPSAKQALPSEILARIPADYVDHIQLIRGQVRGIDMRGHTVVANVILRQDIPAAVRWESFLNKNLDQNMVMPGGGISLAETWRDIDYNVGLEGDYHGHSEEGTRNSYAGDGSLTEDRRDQAMRHHVTGHGNLNASTWWGETLLQLNTELGYTHFKDEYVSRRDPLPLGDPTREAFRDDRHKYIYEIGFNAERSLTPDLIGNAILLFGQDVEDQDNIQRTFNTADDQTLMRRADIDTVLSESIGRLELNWLGWSGHTVQANFEGAWNILDNDLLQTDDTGTGPVVVDVPGANARVEELRGDFLLQDTWSLGQFIFDYGLGLELSTISTSGDSNQERSFTFIKPQTLLTWAPNQNQQTRLRLAREAAQLDLNDFVSATVFRDDDLALGNPDLKPETTWISQLSHERRFDELGVVTLTAFHHWIRDVQDLLPITSDFEAPGNIGDGRRWGLKLESTLPLDWLGLAGARLDLRGRWQNSSVTDPVTGEDRVLSADGGLPYSIPFQDEDIEYTGMIAYRQDFQQARVAWGWEVQSRSERPLFRVNELDVYDEGTDVHAFVETTRFWGMKIRLNANNLLDTERTRDRTLYQGLRSVSSVDRRELTDLTIGRQIELVLSGNF